MQNDDEIIESLILGGIIGAALGALVSKKNGAEIGAVAGAALLATYKASERARKTGLPIILEENNALYEISADGKTKIKIKDLPAKQLNIPETFTLQ